MLCKEKDESSKTVLGSSHQVSPYLTVIPTSDMPGRGSRRMMW